MNRQANYFLIVISIAVVITMVSVISLSVSAAKNPPEINYMLHCQGCHLPGGIGHPGIVPKLQDSVARFLHVEGGRQYLVQVPGVAQSALSDSALAEVLNWLLVEFDSKHLVSDFSIFTESEITKYRNEPLTQVGKTRAALLADYALKESERDLPRSNP